MRLRIKFSKTGSMKYVSHLDIMRYFQKVLRRAGADVAFSEGFSPHMLMSFALPLSLGMESTGEYFDVEMNSCGSTQAFMDEMNRYSTDDCRILSVKSIPQDKANKCMTQVAAADYTVSVSGKGASGITEKTEVIKDSIGAFLARPEIMMLKKTKKGEKETNIRPFIYSFDHKDGCFEMRIGAGSTDHVRCDSVMSAFFESAGIPEEDIIINMIRRDLLLRTDEGFAPLDSIGDEIL